jgi:excinuclease ABC subunit A
MKPIPTNYEHIVLEGASVHNLQNIDLAIPHNKLVVITGVSGSGKSSLAFDTICREGQRRYLESFSTRARQLLGKLGTAQVRSINHLSPAIAIDQKTASGNPRSTVGTMSELYDHLRLLFARLGQRSAGFEGTTPLTRSLFSFNAEGACPSCAGLGVADHIDADLLIKDPSLTLREGALVITTDSGYIIYSQVTMEVLNDVCQAHGFHVDIPWQDLTGEQKQVILYGSKRLKIPFGKHTLESRMKWSGITARPRQEGYYGGIIPIMEQILVRDRNKNILRFARTGNCPECHGTRLCPEALAVTYQDKTIAQLAGLSIAALNNFFQDKKHMTRGEFQETGAAITAGILQRTGLLLDLGLGYLTLDRSAPTLSGGEAQRIRLAGIVGSGLQGMTYVLDEPSVGLHPKDNDRLLLLLHQLVDQGNSVIVVEHDERTMLAADWLIDIGPGAGKNGGQVLFSGPPRDILAAKVSDVLETSPTRKQLLGKKAEMASVGAPSKEKSLHICDAGKNNLKGFDAFFPLGEMTVVTGVSGAGKSSLLSELQNQVQTLLDDENSPCPIDQLITIDQRPIGRTPRSNLATYTGLFDPVRGLFASQNTAKTAKFGKGIFSFNNKGGRCEDCQGAGVQTVGMHFLGDVESLCSTCSGHRFKPEILAITYQSKNISQVLKMSVDEAAAFFTDQKKVLRQLEILQELGLGYLPLGQPSTTLSGGEAQRIKLAAELGKVRKKSPLYILDEPTTGLHAADVENLMRAFRMLTDGGATVVISEHHDAVIRAARCVVDLGPGSGIDGGRLLYSGPPAGLAAVKESVTGAYLFSEPVAAIVPATNSSAQKNVIALKGVQTHNLKNIDLDIPKNKITVITGVSGSGKSSLAMATLCAEGRNRYAENFSTYMRQMLTGRTRPQLASSQGLSPTIAISQKSAGGNRRSIVATVSEIHPLLRLLLARFGTNRNKGETPSPLASQFSFNDHRSACPHCRGLGEVTVADVDRLISHPDKSILAGAMDGHKTGRFYGEPQGQYVATLQAVGHEHGVDFGVVWQELSDKARNLAMAGTGDRQYSVAWQFKRGNHGGTHDFQTAWPGFKGHIQEEYERKHADRRGQAMLAIMKQDLCAICHGKRLSEIALDWKFEGKNMADFCAMTVGESLQFFDQAAVPEQLRAEIIGRLQTLADLGLPYLSLDRTIATLSSGESQRVRLARQLGARLCGVTYVLDEPTLGLHPRDTDRLWHTIERLRHDGNTVVLVEHDLDIIRKADWIVDLGPGPGVHGGEIIVQGTPQQVMQNTHSPTGLVLRKEQCLTNKAKGTFGKSAICTGADLILNKASQNNLKDIDVGFVCGKMTAVAGVSGSGKSSLVFGALGSSALENRSVGCQNISGLDQFKTIVPIGRTSQTATTGSNPATVLGVMDTLRKMLSETETASGLELRKKHFAAAQPGGRCEKCKGRGKLTVSLDFLADVSRKCSSCNGSGFSDEVLQCRIVGLNLMDLLNLTIDEAAATFSNSKKLGHKFQQLAEVGLGYLKLGQETGTLSGGERQRLYLARELLTGGKGNNLYLCDEPSAGLHEADISLLASLFQKLVGAGHTVIFTEHHKGLIGMADHVVELHEGKCRII